MEILGKDYTLVTLDAETYFGTGCSLSLQALNTYTYLTHPDFSIHGMGVKVDDNPTVWIPPSSIQDFLDDIWETSNKPIALLCHNTYFDGYILHHFYDLHPDLYLDTMGMSRGMFPNAKAGLADLAERLWPHDPAMRKGKELINFRNVTTEALYANPPALQKMIEYCDQDVELTYAAFLRMLPHYPDRELELIHLTLQMTCEPLLLLDVPRVERARESLIAERDALIAASGYAEKTLSSDVKFLELLQKNRVQIKRKPKPKSEDGETIPALGKADLGFQQMKAAHPELKALFEGRVAAKSTGQIARAARFLQTAEVCGGYMPCPLIYYSALTGRYGGCLSGDTEVIVYSQGECITKPITLVADDDLVWDGTAFVTHGGVVFSGYQEVIHHDGITGTPAHVVFTLAGEEKPLAEARQDGDRLAVPPGPDDDSLVMARAYARDRHQAARRATLPMRRG